MGKTRIISALTVLASLHSNYASVRVVFPDETIRDDEADKL